MQLEMIGSGLVINPALRELGIDQGELNLEGFPSGPQGPVMRTLRAAIVEVARRTDGWLARRAPA
jgi:hypothetical protein